MLNVRGVVSDETATISNEKWLGAGRDRCRNALSSARAVPDRLALLREWARLNDGHLSLAEHGLTLSPEEEFRLADFGLEVWNGRLNVAGVSPGLPRGAAEAFRLDSSERRIGSPATADAALLRWSAHDHYRSDTQKAAIRALLTMPAGASMMVSMPTGTGKSLLFQMAPSLWGETNVRPCVVVITPTIALAIDHERTLKSIPALSNSRAITSQLDYSERETVLNAFRRGEVPVLLLSPEQAFGAARSALLEAAQHPSTKFDGLAAHLTAFVVDEAHIIESWGRSFRPDFQRLPGIVEELRKNNPSLRTILLSATLGRSARTQLRTAYGKGDWLEIHAGVPRYEFDLATAFFSNVEDRDRALRATINHAPRPAIIYTNLVEHARSVYEQLHQFGHRRLALFTGEVSDGKTRQAIIDDWAAERLDLVVATSAFGMGIDKANVRSIIHAALPEGPSRYYQEIGRSARDGHQGSAVCLWYEDATREDDVAQARGLASGSWITREKAEKRWRAIRQWGKSNGGLKWVGSRRRMTINLDAVREGLSGETSDYNRLWNMSVLNMLQRLEMLQVTGVVDSESDIPTWQVDIIDDDILDEAIDKVLWDRIEERRAEERGAATQEFRSFHKLVRNSSDACLLTNIYQLIDPEGAMAPDCGRCGPCRQRGVKPPLSIASHGLDRLWASTTATRENPFPRGITMVIPNDPDLTGALEDLLLVLAELGIEQSIVPDHLAGTTARILQSSQAAFGLVLSHTDVLRKSWALAPMPTALLIDRGAEVETLWRLLKRQAERDHEQRFILVAPAEAQAEGRPLQQIASKQAPLAQDVLSSLRSSHP